MNAQRTSAEETERTLRAESVLSDDRLPVKWDGEYIYWADTPLWRNIHSTEERKRSGSWTNPTMGRKAATPSSKENSTSKKQSRLIPAERTEMIGMTRPKAKDRPRGKPFDEPERKYLCSLDIIDACTEKRITWNKTFIEYAEKELEAGSRPVDIFRGAGVGPELIGRKRIERCVARWRAKIKKEERQ